MKKTLFLVHDPGGYDALFPVVKLFLKEEQAFEFFCIGPAALIDPQYAITEDRLNQMIDLLLIKDEVSALVTGTSWGSSIELQMIQKVKLANHPTLSIIDYWSNYAARYKLEAKYVFPDYCIVMDEIAKNEALAEGLPKQIIQVLGQPGLDQFIKTSSLAKQYPYQTNKLKTLFLSQPLESIYGHTFGYTETEVIEQCIELALKRPQIALTIKLHPKEDAHIKKKYAHMAITGDLKTILPAFDLVIGMSTIGLLHAVLMGVPAISFQPNLQVIDRCITNKLGLSSDIRSFDTLVSTIDLLLSGSHLLENSVDSQALLWLDGNSTERVYSFIRGVIQT